GGLTACSRRRGIAVAVGQEEGLHSAHEHLALFEQPADMCRGQNLDVVTVLCVTHVYYSFRSSSLSSAPLALPAGLPAKASVPIRCPSRSWASAPSRSCIR